MQNGEGLDVEVTHGEWRPGRPAGLHQRHQAGGSRPRLGAAHELRRGHGPPARLARDYARRLVRIVFADAAGFTPSYDHELAACASAGRRRGRACHLAVPVCGVVLPGLRYLRSEVFYPFSSRVFRPLEAADSP
jgi:hypothetical protein